MKNKRSYALPAVVKLIDDNPNIADHFIVYHSAWCRWYESATIFGFEPSSGEGDKKDESDIWRARNAAEGYAKALNDTFFSGEVK